MLGYVLFGLLVVLFFFLLAMRVYGTYLSFCKKWYVGIAALIVPGFAEVIGFFKFACKKDLLQ